MSDLLSRIAATVPEEAIVTSVDITFRWKDGMLGSTSIACPDEEPDEEDPDPGERVTDNRRAALRVVA